MVRKPDDHENCVLIKTGKISPKLGHLIYNLYQRADGRIHAETICATTIVANSLEEYNALSEEEIDRMIYSGEMTIAR